jgi:hypothetical protein
LTHPDPRYHWPAVEQLAAAFWRSPFPGAEESKETDMNDLLFDSGS